MASRSVAGAGRRWLASIAFAVVGAGTLSLSAWGEGVDIFPFIRSDDGGTDQGQRGRSDKLGLMAVYREDGGDVWAEPGDLDAPGVRFDSVHLRELYEGAAADAGKRPVSFEIALVDPFFQTATLGLSGLKVSGDLRLHDLSPWDAERPILEAGSEGHGILLVYVGDANRMGEDPFGVISGMQHVDTRPLPRPVLDLNAFREEARATFGGAGLDVGLVLFDQSRQFAVAVFSADSHETKYRVITRDPSHR